MDFYIDIRIKPDEEMRENVLLNKVYTKLHKALNTLESTSVGVSFPHYQVMLGRLLRIHGSKANLLVLDEMKWLGGLIGYCDLSEILVVPSDVKHRVISRKQSSMSQAKLRRLMTRRPLENSDIKEYKAKMFNKGLDEPYLELSSSSNGHFYRRYLSFGDIQDDSVSGEFDHFGLSKQATVPVF